MAEVLFRAKLQRDDPSHPWGFRLQGGADFDKPLTLLKVVDESLACRGGLKPGDILVKLGGKYADGMTHKDAQAAIMDSADALEIIVERAEEEALTPLPTLATPGPPLPSGGNHGDTEDTEAKQNHKETQSKIESNQSKEKATKEETRGETSESPAIPEGVGPPTLAKEPSPHTQSTNTTVHTDTNIPTESGQSSADGKLRTKKDLLKLEDKDTPVVTGTKPKSIETKETKENNKKVKNNLEKKDAKPNLPDISVDPTGVVKPKNRETKPAIKPGFKTDDSVNDNSECAEPKLSPVHSKPADRKSDKCEVVESKTSNTTTAVKPNTSGTKSGRPKTSDTTTAVKPNTSGTKSGRPKTSDTQTVGKPKTLDNQIDGKSDTQNVVKHGNSKPKALESKNVAKVKGVNNELDTSGSKPSKAPQNKTLVKTNASDSLSTGTLQDKDIPLMTSEVVDKKNIKPKDDQSTVKTHKRDSSPGVAGKINKEKGTLGSTENISGDTKRRSKVISTETMLGQTEQPVESTHDSRNKPDANINGTKRKVKIPGTFSKSQSNKQDNNVEVLKESQQKPDLVVKGQSKGQGVKESSSESEQVAVAEERLLSRGGQLRSRSRSPRSKAKISSVQKPKEEAVEIIPDSRLNKTDVDEFSSENVISTSQHQQNVGDKPKSMAVKIDSQMDVAAPTAKDGLEIKESTLKSTKEPPSLPQKIMQHKQSVPVIKSDDSVVSAGEPKLQSEPKGSSVQDATPREVIYPTRAPIAPTNSESKKLAMQPKLQSPDYPIQRKKPPTISVTAPEIENQQNQEIVKQSEAGDASEHGDDSSAQMFNYEHKEERMPQTGDRQDSSQVVQGVKAKRQPFSTLSENQDKVTFSKSPVTSKRQESAYARMAHNVSPIVRLEYLPKEELVFKTSQSGQDLGELGKIEVQETEKKHDTDLYPWRRSRSLSQSEDSSSKAQKEESPSDSNIPPLEIPPPQQVEAPKEEVKILEDQKKREIPPPVEVIQTEPLKPSLKLVGKRIEKVPPSAPPSALPGYLIQGSYASPPGSGSPLTGGGSPQGRASPLNFPSYPSNTVPTGIVAPTPQYHQDHSFIHPGTGIQTVPAQPGYHVDIPPLSIDTRRSYDSENNAYQPPALEDIHFSTASPDLVDIPMPAVKEMVADLNRRLEAIAAQHPKLAEPSNLQELGLSYLKRAAEQSARSGGESAEEKEIFINSPPTDIEHVRNRLFDAVSEVQNAYQRLYESASPLQSPSVQRRSLQSSSPRPDHSAKSQRRVHFAEPPEQSVIEIEPRSRSSRAERASKSDNRSGQTPELYRKHEEDLAKDLLSLSLASAANRQVTARHPGYPHLQHKDPLPPRESPFSSASVTKTTVTTPVQRPDYFSSPSMRPVPYSGQLSTQAHGTPGAAGGGAVSGGAAGGGATRMIVPATGTAAHKSPQISVSITQRNPEQGGHPEKIVFTLPSGQPGHPTHFRYTISGRKSDQDPKTINYSFPPSYEESQRHRPRPLRQSIDDSMMSTAYGTRLQDRYILNTAAGPLSPAIHSRFSQPAFPDPSMPNYRWNDQYYARSPAISPAMSPAMSPVMSPMTSPRMSPQPRDFMSSPHQQPPRDRPASSQTIQSKSFKALEAQYTDPHLGGNIVPSPSGVDVPLRVEVHPLGAPRQVLQPAAVSRTFLPESDLFSPPAAGSGPFSPPGYGMELDRAPSPGLASPGLASAGLLSPSLAGSAMIRLPFPSGVFALFDRAFTEKFLQWQGHGRRSHFQSETYKLVHEMDDDKKRSGPEDEYPGPPHH